MRILSQPRTLDWIGYSASSIYPVLLFPWLSTLQCVRIPFYMSSPPAQIKKFLSLFLGLNFKSFSVSPIIAGVDGDGSPEDITVILNSPTSLVCEAYSYPPATITWFKNGTPLESNQNIRILPGNQLTSDTQDAFVPPTCIKNRIIAIFI